MNAYFIIKHVYKFKVPEYLLTHFLINLIIQNYLILKLEGIYLPFAIRTAIIYLVVYIK